MKIVLDFLHLCENVIISRRDQKVTLVNIFTSAHGENVPISLARFFIVGALGVSIPKTTTKDKIVIELQIVSGENTNLLRATVPRVEAPLDTEREDQKVGFVFELRGISFPNFGDYKLKIFVEGKELGEITLEITKS